MDAKNVVTHKNLLPRKEVTVDIAFEQATPNRKQIKQMVADKLKVKADLLIIRHIYTTYGGKEAKIVAYLYENEEAMKNLEYEKMMTKNSDKKPAAEAKAE